MGLDGVNLVDIRTRRFAERFVLGQGEAGAGAGSYSRLLSFRVRGRIGTLLATGWGYDLDEVGIHSH